MRALYHRKGIAALTIYPYPYTPMESQQHSHYSQALDREMTYKTYGTEGRPVLVFASQSGH